MAAMEMHMPAGGLTEFIERHLINVDAMYGITCPTNLNYALLRLFYHDAKGKLRTINRTRTYNTEAGRESAVKHLQELRAELIQRPEVQEYLKRCYLPGRAPGRDSPRHPPRKDGAGFLDGLSWVRVRRTSRALTDDQSIQHWAVVAHASDPDPDVTKRAARSFSIKKYGLPRALYLATLWQAETENRQPPSGTILANAQQAIIARYGDRITAEIGDGWQ